MVLLVDDDEDFRVGLAEALRDDGFVVGDFAASGSLPPLDHMPKLQCAITDYHLGNETGLALADRLHEHYPQLPVVIVTAFSSRDLEEAVATRVHVKLLSKPVHYDQLRSLLPRLRAHHT